MTKELQSMLIKTIENLNIVNIRKYTILRRIENINIENHDDILNIFKSTSILVLENMDFDLGSRINIFNMITNSSSVTELSKIVDTHFL